MRLIGNLIWILMGGIIISAAWLFVGILFCITVVGVPFGVQCFKFAKMVLCPFGKKIYYGNMGSGSVILNVIWVLLCGVELALSSVVMGITCCLTIVGIPFGLQHFKFAMLALTPFGAEIRKV